MNESTIPLIPARMVNEHVYCPRLVNLMWVQRKISHTADTLEVTSRHKWVDLEGGG